MQFVNNDFVVLFCASEHLLHVCHLYRSTVDDYVWWVLTLFTEGGLRAPGEVQLTGEGLSSHQVVSRVALVGDPSPSHQRNVGRRLPAVLDLGQVWTGVIPGHLWEKEKRKERRKVDEWMRYAGVIACGAASVQGMFPVAHGGPAGRDESRINNTTPDSDTMLARILCEEESALRKIDGLIVRSLDRVTEWWICAGQFSNIIPRHTRTVCLWSCRVDEPVGLTRDSHWNGPEWDDHRLSAVTHGGSDPPQERSVVLLCRRL